MALKVGFRAQTVYNPAVQARVAIVFGRIACVPVQHLKSNHPMIALKKSIVQIL